MSDATQQRATVSGRKYFSLVWLAPLASIALLAYLVLRQLPSQGPDIEILVIDAAGIQANQTRVQYLGVPVGTVRDVALDTAAGGVRIRVDMREAAEPLLRDNTLFWVVRPRIGLSSIQELGTLITGPYLSLQPGDGEPRTRFTALHNPPGPERRDSGLNIVLQGVRLGTMRVGTPIRYRDIEVGELYQYQMEEDSTGVLMFAHINAPYAPLVRDNTVFWNSGGVEVDIGLSGAELSAGSLASLLTGSIAMAVPDVPGEPAQAGAEFILYGNMEDEWEQWQPAIPIEPVTVRDGGSGDAAARQSLRELQARESGGAEQARQ